MLAKSLKDLFDFQMKRELIYFDDIKLNKTETHFFSSGIETFTLKASSVFLSAAFQFIMAEKCSIQVIFYNVARTFAYAIAQILNSHALVMMWQS